MKAIKVLVVSAILIMITALPVMAHEVTDPEKVYMENAFNADECILINDFHGGEITRCENYVKYLNGVIFNLEDTARIKKEVVTNYKYLSQYNSYYATLIPQAQKDYDNAVAWVNAYKEYTKAVQADLKVRYKY